MKEQVAAILKSALGIKILDALFFSPMLRNSDFMQVSGLNHQTTFRTLTRLKKGILSTIQKPAGRSPEVLRFDRLYSLLND